jgi:hypothetical protein
MQRLSLLVVGIVLALLSGELLLRIVGYPGAEERRVRRFDARYGAVARDSWIWDFRIDKTVHRAVDLRGQFIDLPKPPGETRVLFLGDSATEGAFVAPEAAYPHVFQTLLDQRSPSHHVHAINAGVWGMTTIDEYHLLEDKLLPLEPDVVVVGLFMANDINMNLAHRERVTRVSSLFDALRTHSALVHFGSLQALAWSSRRRPLHSDEPALSLVNVGLVDQRGLHMLSYPAGELATYVQPASSLVDHAFDVLAQVFADLQRLGDKHGFSVRVLLIPSPSRVLGRLAILHYPNLLRELADSGVKIDAGSIDVAAPTRRVLAICGRLELACVDPSPRLAHLGARAFFPTDEHPTAAAHRALAEALLAH